MTVIQRIWHADPRWYQILSLATLLLYGIVFLHFDFDIIRAGSIITAGLVSQYAFTKTLTADRFEPKSALISCLSLCLLLRTDSLIFAMLAAVIAIGSKFLARIKGKHFFNPTNIGIVALLLFTNHVWVSPSQWGTTAFLGFLILFLGSFVVTKASRLDITAAFLVSYALIQISRAAWLGDPLTIPLHRLQNGALLIFSFFMISDPRTTPNARSARVLFAAAVTLLAGVLQFKFFVNNSALWALAICSPFTLLLDRVFTGERYYWNSHKQGSIDKVGGTDETTYAPVPAQFVSVTERRAGIPGVLRLLRGQGRQQTFQQSVARCDYP